MNIEIQLTNCIDCPLHYFDYDEIAPKHDVQYSNCQIVGRLRNHPPIHYLIARKKYPCDW